MKKKIWIIAIFFILIVILGINFDKIFPSNWDYESCIDECQHRGYSTGNCKWPSEIESEEVKRRE